MSRFHEYINEEWHVRPVAASMDAMMKYRKNEYTTIIFIYLPRPTDMFIHMKTDDGIVHVNNNPVKTITDEFDKHHQDIALAAMQKTDVFYNYDAESLYRDDEILEMLEYDFKSVRGFIYKNDVYFYPVGGYNKFKSNAMLKLKIYLDDDWWIS